MKQAIVILLIWAGFIQETTQAQKRVKIDEEAFDIAIEGNQLFLSFKNDRIELAKGRNWFFNYKQVGGEASPIDTLLLPSVSNLPSPNVVKAVKLLKHQYLLLLSFYSAPSDSRIASGADILLAFNALTKDFSPVSSEVTMPTIGRGWGPCRNATMNSYLIQDVNDDGFLDIGVLREMIKCDFENDAPSKPYYEQDPVKWYIDMSHDYSDIVWIPNLPYKGLLPEKYTELTSLSRSPVDVVGSNLWKTTNRLEWPSKMRDVSIIITKSLRQRAAQEAKQLKDKSITDRIESHQYVRKEPSILSYDWVEIRSKAENAILDSLDFQIFSLTSLGNSDYYTYVNEYYNIAESGFHEFSHSTWGDFVEAVISFEFRSLSYDWVIGEALIHFDKDLHLQKPIEFKSIPNFMMNGKPYNYLTKEQALDASVKHSSATKNPFLKLAEIKRNREQQPDYHWEIQNYHKYPRDSAHVCFVQEIILLDPTTGKLILKKEPNQSESFINCPTDQ